MTPGLSYKYSTREGERRGEDNKQDGKQKWSWTPERERGIPCPQLSFGRRFERTIGLQTMVVK